MNEHALNGLLAGKVAIVTGAGSGIGQATAALFAEQGARVVLAERDVQAGGRAAEQIAAAGGQATFVETDVSRESDVERAVQHALSVYGTVDVLFNNAGIEQPVTPSVHLSAEVFDRVISVNLRGTYLFCKHVLPIMLERGGGTIVNNSSVSAFANVGGNLAYAASKGAVMSMTRVLAIEYAQRGIRVNAVCPGVIDTGMNRRNLDLAEDPVATAERWLQHTPLGRMGTAREAAMTVLYLASEMSTFTTGVGLLIDGGRVAT